MTSHQEPLSRGNARLLSLFRKMKADFKRGYVIKSTKRGRRYIELLRSNSLPKWMKRP